MKKFKTEEEYLEFRMDIHEVAEEDRPKWREMFEVRPCNCLANNCTGWTLHRKKENEVSSHS